MAACMGALDASTLAAAEERRDLVLVMLAKLHSAEEGWLLKDVDLQLGFSRLLGKIGDLADAWPYTQEMLVGLLRGAIEVELLPAEFLKIARRMRFGGPVGVEVVRKVQRQTPMHSRRVWGTGDARQFRMEVWQTIVEYFDSKSLEELAQIVEELHLNEKEQARFMRKLMIAGMQRQEPKVALDAVESLMGICWDRDQVLDAFYQLREVQQDLFLDMPDCRERTDELVVMAAARGLLEQADVALDKMTIV